MRLAILASTVFALALGACGGDETEPEEGHTPASAKLFGPTGTELTPVVTLTRGQTLRIEVRFYADDGDLITGIEDHFSGLTFAPGALATVAAVAGQPFRWVVTAAAAGGTGTVSVGFGHDAAADELTFGPFGVTVP